MKMRLTSPMRIGRRAAARAVGGGGPERVAALSQRWIAPRIAKLMGRSEIPSLAEVKALNPATRVLIAGLSGCIVLVALMTMAAVASVEMSAVSLPEWLSSSASIGRGAVARSPANFENIVQRPLFSRSRQGATIVPAFAPVAMPPQPVGLDQNLTLKGVFMSEGLAKGFFITAQNPAGVWVQQGEEIVGWRVVAVQPDLVRLSGKGENLVLPLNVGGTK